MAPVGAARLLHPRAGRATAVGPRLLIRQVNTHLFRS